MGTTAFSVLLQRLSEQIGDWISVATTTNITTNNFIYSTNLNEFDMASDDFFIPWWVYLSTTANADVERRVKDYTTSGAKLEVFGAALAAESAAQTIQVTRYRRTDRENAINDALRELYPTLHKPLDNRQLITGNIMPPFRWATTSTLDIYTIPTGTLTKTTTAGKTRGGLTSAYIDAGAADDAIVLDSNNYPRLLDLMGKTVTLKCWASPQTASDAFLDIVTTDSASADTTKSSTTACPAGAFTLLKIEDYAVPDDSVRIRINLRVHTDGEYTYFAEPRLTGHGIYELLLPDDVEDGSIAQVWIQSSGYSDDPCDDLNPRFGRRLFDYDTVERELFDAGGVYSFLQLKSLNSNNYRLKLLGDTPIPVLSAATDTIPFDRGNHLNMLIAYAKYKLWSTVSNPPSPQDSRKYKSAAAEAYGEYLSLRSQGRMARTPGTMRLQ